MIRKLIVNHDGHLSALPTVDEFSLGGFASDPTRFFLYEVTVNANDLANIWLNRDRAVVLSPDCPLKEVGDIADPTFYYVQVTEDMQLVPLTIPQGVYLSYAQIMARVRVNEQFNRAKQGRFSSEATETLYYYDGSDFLLYAMAFVQRAETAPFSCSTSASGPWLPVEHTPLQVMAVGADYSTWYNSLQVRFYNAQAAIDAAQSVETTDNINF